VNRRWVRVSAVVLVAVALLAGVVVLQYGIDSQQSSVRGSTATAPRDTARSVLDLMGGVRETFAAYLWVKTDNIFHGFLGEDIASDGPIFPYFWLITRLDPHYIEAYYFASWMLCRYGKVQEGFDMALDGVRNNPNSEMLQKNLAEIYLFYMHDMPKAKYHLEKALKLATNEGDMALVNNELALVQKIRSGERKVPSPLTIEKERQIQKNYSKLHKD
jgi:hypothetical protein